MLSGISEAESLTSDEQKALVWKGLGLGPEDEPLTGEQLNHLLRDAENKYKLDPNEKKPNDLSYIIEEKLEDKCFLSMLSGRARAPSIHNAGGSMGPSK